MGPGGSPSAYKMLLLLPKRAKKVAEKKLGTKKEAQIRDVNCPHVFFSRCPKAYYSLFLEFEMMSDAGIVNKNLIDLA